MNQHISSGVRYDSKSQLTLCLQLNLSGAKNVAFGADKLKEYPEIHLFNIMQNDNDNHLVLC